ncbi:MAG: hypothetical protein NZ602_02130, partial [Thermoguttaceae bacterium]|nr:hypothetical protein [Thermoguttaceae bacterium]
MIEGIDHLEWMLRSAADGAILQELGPVEHALLTRLPVSAGSSGALVGAAIPGEPAESLQAALEEMCGPGAAPVPQPTSPPAQHPSTEPPGGRSDASFHPTSPSFLEEKAEQETVSGARDSSSFVGSPSPIRYVRIKESYLDEFLEEVSHLFITGELLRELETRIPEHVLGRNLAEELHRICQD